MRQVNCENDFKCTEFFLKSLSSSSDLTCFEVNHSNSVLFAVIYRPPKYNENFVNDFSEFLPGIMFLLWEILISMSAALTKEEKFY